jgi:hypothetical protein
MSTRQLYILDFDRTLFDTRRFFEDMKAALKRTHQLDMKAFAKTFESFIEPATGGYDPHRHHGELLGLTPGELDQVVAAELGHEDYTFPDAAAWLSSQAHAPNVDLVIVTMGRPRYQELKFQHSAPVRDIRKIVVNTNKGAIIRRHLKSGGGEYALEFLDQPYRTMTLIDDSADTFTALGNTGQIDCIRIARPGEKYTELPTPAHVRHITSFGELS